MKFKKFLLFIILTYFLVGCNQTYYKNYANYTQQLSQKGTVNEYSKQQRFRDSIDHVEYGTIDQVKINKITSSSAKN